MRQKIGDLGSSSTQNMFLLGSAVAKPLNRHMGQHIRFRPKMRFCSFFQHRWLVTLSVSIVVCEAPIVAREATVEASETSTDWPKTLKRGWAGSAWLYFGSILVGRCQIAKLEKIKNRKAGPKKDLPIPYGNWGVLTIQQWAQKWSATLWALGLLLSVSRNSQIFNYHAFW